ncbi:DUF6065 family protein [Streptomyces sp. RFCAC02]|uniref:DUF6065 family protein n=1 Tax=Streptomyces sp. RFCAC02 TaxID=2499143 RepID=UPI00102270E9|nr:DUF6065 family protein [Streptomyces sp. RFCAC02]
MTTTPFSFRACFDGAVPPTAADPAALGTAPFRAVSHCEPLRAASGFGWYLYPPVDCFLKWDGSSFRWLAEGWSDWLPLTDVAAGTMLRLLGGDPPDDPVLGLPVLSAAPEPGLLQVWTGLIARTPPDWSLLVRSVPNLPGSLTYEVQDGLIETGWWHGPLVGNLRFRRSDEVVRLSRRYPLFAVQPVPAEAYRPETLGRFEFVAADDDSLPESRGMVADALAVRREDRPGGYRREVSRRRRAAACPVAPPADEEPAPRS